MREQGVGVVRKPAAARCQHGIALCDKLIKAPAE